MSDAVAIIGMCAAMVAFFGILAWVFVSLVSMPVGQILIGVGLFAAGFAAGQAAQAGQPQKQLGKKNGA